MIDTIAFVLTGIGLAASIVYYANILNNANRTRELQLKSQEQALETRQASIFTQIAYQLYSKEHVTIYFELIDWEWNDYQDFYSKYGQGENRVKRMMVWLNFDLVGRLMREGLLDRLLVSQLLGSAILRSWNKFEPIIIEDRKEMGPHWMTEWEYAFNEIKQVYDQTFTERL